MKFIRCSSPSDILVVPRSLDAESISGRVSNPCHNHLIMVRAEYEKALAPLLARAECAEKLSEALSKIVMVFDKSKFDYEMADAMKKGLYEEAESALAAWDSIKKEGKP